MQLDFTGLFNSSGDVLNIDEKLFFDDFEYGTYKPLTDGVSVKGRAYCKADVAHLELTLSFIFNGICDRCADEFSREYSFGVNKVVVSHLENEDDDDEYLIADADNKINLDDTVYEEIQLFLPQKMLCSDDCKGLCPKCGKNLNREKCDCEKDVDPRMAVLLQLLDEE
ncbi:MAG: DUF177 domain-containing protein [Eubacterium sp.]|nr:DUF177 domain-containing protein [Eubacterium sp.]